MVMISIIAFAIIGSMSEIPTYCTGGNKKSPEFSFEACI
jgi:hypothetical protein